MGHAHVREILHSNMCLTRAFVVHHEVGMLLSMLLHDDSTYNTSA